MLLGRTNWSVGFADVAPYDEWVIVGGKQTKLERIRSLKRILRWDMGRVEPDPANGLSCLPTIYDSKLLDWRGNYVV